MEFVELHFWLLKSLIASSHPLVDPECSCWVASAQMSTSPSWKEGWDWSKPVILSKVSALFDNSEEVRKRMVDFGSLFAGSSIRVTEGRAQAPLPDELLQSVPRFLADACSSATSRIPAFLLSDIPAELQQSFPHLHQSMAASTFGIAASHTSVGKFECRSFHLCGSHIKEADSKAFCCWTGCWRS